MYQTGARQYQQLNVQTNVTEANPHQLIAMLFDGLLSRLAMARGFIDREDYEGKSKALGAAVSILGALQESLDLEQGGDLAANLHGLYLYMTHRVFTAGVENDIAIIDEVVALVKTVKEGWDGIREQAQ